MHIERRNLPHDVNEIFFSDRFWYAASEAAERLLKRDAEIAAPNKDE